MRTLLQSVWALAFVAVAALATTASAGEPVKLLIEPPKDTTHVEAGDPGIDVQVVPQDASGNRVAPGGNVIEVSATEGEFTVVKSPYSYRYMPPGAVDQPRDIKLRAWFKQNPDVKGEVTLTLMPTRPYESLVLQAPSTTIELGRSMEIQILGVKSDGKSVIVANQRITMAQPEGAGAIEFVTQAVYNLKAPAKSESRFIGATVHLRAWLERYPKVKGELSVVITAEGPPTAPGGGPSPPPTKPPYNPPPYNPPSNPPTPPSNPPTPPTRVADPEFPDGVVWPSGNVMLAAWRVRATKDDPWPEKRHGLPNAGNPLIARMQCNIVRVVVLRPDVTKVAMEWYTGDRKNAAIRVDDGDKDGRLKLVKSKSGRTCAMIEMDTPEVKPIVVDLLLTTGKGEVVKETFVFQRGADRDDDGEKDRKK